ncbi:Protein of unknown function [Gryllus bimaculatus]|nr:Protein of unknown function [Gryllus bimaculatus]
MVVFLHSFKRRRWKVRRPSPRDKTPLRATARGVVADAPPCPATPLGLLRSQSSSSSLCSGASLCAPSAKAARPRARRHRLQRLAAVEDDEDAHAAANGASAAHDEEEEEDDAEDEEDVVEAAELPKTAVVGGFRARFPRPAFRLPRSSSGWSGAEGNGAMVILAARRPCSEVLDDHLRGGK